MATLDSVRGDRSERDSDFYASGGWGDEDAKQIVLDTIDAHNLTPGSSVLDAGCGDGRFAQAFHKAGFWVTGFDLSLDAIETARERFPGPGYFQANAEEPLTAVREFDVVFCRGITHTARPRDEHSDAVFSNLNVALKPGGTLILERNTDGSGKPGESAYFPGQMRANPTAAQLCSLIDPWFTVEEVLTLPGRIQIRATKR
jgi:2-polyprenyl-3-methyl-5-hydroxy-6-metoxy-1,4-benzoquinol methylase